MSALIHWIAAKSVHPYRTFDATVIFFLLQPIGFVLETAAISVGKRLGLESYWWRILGYAWVVGFLTITASAALDESLNAGFLPMGPMFPSIVGCIIEGTG